MNGRYKKPPIEEVVCEIRFSKDTEWDATIPGLVYERIRSEFPNKKSNSVPRVEVRKEDGKTRKIYTIEDRSVFSTEKGNIIIQIGERVLAINSIKKYPSWSKFQPVIKNAMNSLGDIISIKGIIRIGLRFINKIEIPGEKVELSDYFNFRPYIGETLPKIMQSFRVMADFPFQKNRDLCKAQISCLRSEKEVRRFILDFDYFLRSPMEIDSKEVLDWIENAHLEIKKMFEGSISDKLEQLFNNE